MFNHKLSKKAGVNFKICLIDSHNVNTDGWVTDQSLVFCCLSRKVVRTQEELKKFATNSVR